MEERVLSEMEKEILNCFLLKKNFWANGGYPLSVIARRNLEKAQKVCASSAKSPAELVEFVFSNLGERKCYFSLYHLSDSNARRRLSDQENFKREAGNLVSFSTITPEALLNHLYTLLKIYSDSGESEESVLADSTIDFPSWFRILATAIPNKEIISNYLEEAQISVHASLLDFLKGENLDLSRIFP